LVIFQYRHHFNSGKIIELLGIHPPTVFFIIIRTLTSSVDFSIPLDAVLREERMKDAPGTKAVAEAITNATEAAEYPLTILDV
jgi:hypothetical protein